MLIRIILGRRRFKKHPVPGGGWRGGEGGGGSFSRNAFVCFGFTTHVPRLRCTARFVYIGEKKEKEIV